MKIAVLGTGMVGRAVAVGLANLGLDVVIGTRHPDASLASTGAEDFGTWAAMHGHIGVATYAQASRDAVLVVNALNGAVSVAGVRSAEIADGTVEIPAVAREAGHRSKIAVKSTVSGVNAKGACIGPMGQRVRNVMSELHGEKIDIVDWSDDPAEFVANALSPATVTKVDIVDAATKSARVVVPDFKLSLAIGKEGQNARLAAKLTGAKIDIQPDSILEDR